MRRIATPTTLHAFVAPGHDVLGQGDPDHLPGQRFPNRAALARYLAPLVAAGADRIEQVLWRPNGSR